MGKHQEMPRNIDAEKALLGALLTTPDLIAGVVPKVNDVDFYLEKHKRIYGRLVAMHQDDEPIDLITFSNSFEKDGELADIGGLAYLMSFDEYATVATSRHVEAHAKIISDKARARFTAQAMMASLESLLNGSMGPDECANAVFDVAHETKKANAVKTQQDLVKEVFAQLELEYDGQVSRGHGTCWAMLDSLIHIEHENMLVIAARPAMGKTAFTIQLATHWARNLGMPCDIYGCEMSDVAQARRQLAHVSGVQTRRPKMFTENDWRKIAKGSEAQYNLPMRFVDAVEWTVDDIEASVRQRVREIGPHAFFVDHIGLLVPPKGVQQGRENVKNSSNQLKRMAKKYGCTAVVLSQLNRNLEQRTNKRPMMSDLRECGDIEQDADVILFLYRKAPYAIAEAKENSDPNEAKSEKDLPPEVREYAEVIVGKGREGEVGIVPLRWLGSIQTFEEVVTY